LTHAPPPDRFIWAPEGRKAAVLDVIGQARRQLRLSLFRCRDADVFEALAQATLRGVAVDVLVTPRAKGGKQKLESLWRRLEETGARVHAYRDPVVKYHAKYVVADDGPALIASLNFTPKCFDRTWDALVVTHDPDVVHALQRLMDTDRRGLPLPDDVSPRLIVGPERARRQLTALMEGARSTIRLIDGKLSDPNLVALLNARRTEGLSVEVFGSKRIAGLKSHGKIMLIDERVAVVGSLALSALSLDFRREVAIRIEEPSAIAAVSELFGSIRAAAMPMAGPHETRQAP
jgi:phosphatidylserine/phosphatidylglycerophosphate/cardiolipin synthase-like enzyme